jgi:hypothetical protein
MQDVDSSLKGGYDLVGRNCIKNGCEYIGRPYPNKPGDPADKVIRDFHIPPQGAQPNQKKE